MMRNVACLFALVLLASVGTSEAQLVSVTELYADADATINVGVVTVENDPSSLVITIEPEGGWMIAAYQIYVGEDSVPTAASGNPQKGKFPYQDRFQIPLPDLELVLDFGEFPPDVEAVNIAIHCGLMMFDGNGNIIAEQGAWAWGPYEFLGPQWGWWFEHLIQGL